MTGRETVSVVVLVVLIALALWAMRRGWNHRRKRTEDLVHALPAVPADLGERRTASLEAVYVSTTRAGDWLDRVVAQDLGVRSEAWVSVRDVGVLIERTGAPDVFLPAGTLRAVATAPGMAGKVVGGDGLVVLTWQPDPIDERGLDTGLRPKHHADGPLLVDAVSALIAGTNGTKEKS